ncbi:MAG: hypothetical protein AAGC78_04660 [Cellvibrio sp.]|uniref:hypothetical protein n=1 Tax=Cellvibrio sp. TaxID=1965322 RepID=UPI0031AB8ADA
MKIKKICVWISIFLVMLFPFNVIAGELVKEGVQVVVPDDFISACEQNLPPVAISINRHEGTVNESNTESIRRLNDIRLKTNDHASEGDMLGLTLAQLSWEYNVMYRSFQMLEPNIHCARPEIKVDMVVINHTVYIAKELPRGSCEYEVIREHEYRHVKINEENFKNYAKKLADDFQKEFNSKIYYGPLDVVDKAIKDEMQKYWGPFIERTTKKLEKDGHNLHKSIDTPEEYARIPSMCSGGITRIMNSYKQQ